MKKALPELPVKFRAVFSVTLPSSHFIQTQSLLFSLAISLNFSTKILCFDPTVRIPSQICFFLAQIYLSGGVLFAAYRTGMETNVNVAVISHNLLTCAGEAALVVSMVLSMIVKTQLLTLTQDYLKLLKDNPKMKGDYHTSCPSKPLDAEDDSDADGDEDGDGDGDGDGDDGEGEEGEDVRDNPNNKGTPKKGQGGGAGGAEENGEEENDDGEDDQEDENDDEDNPDDDDDEEEENDGEEEVVEEEDEDDEEGDEEEEEDEDEDEEEEDLQPPKKRKK